jgi:hypothetical protein
VEELETPIELMQEKSQQPESTNSPTRPFSVRGTGAVPRCAHVACELKRSLLLASAFSTDSGTIVNRA